jgi:phosphoserine aminotransferase
MLNYKVHAESDSLYNTPPTYAIYISMLVFRWLDSLGGVEEIYKLNKEKASLLFDFIDNSAFLKAMWT